MECTYASFPAIIPPPNITHAYEEAVCTRMLRQAKLESATELQQSNLAQLKRVNDFRLEQTELLTESYRKALEGISGTLKKEEAVKAAEALSRPNFFAPYEYVAKGMKEMEATESKE